MTQYVEMFAPVVVGKSRHRTKFAHTLMLGHIPSSILECWVTNHTYEVRNQRANAEIMGYYDVNVWYSFNDAADYDLLTARMTYTEEVPIYYRSKAAAIASGEIIVQLLQPPSCARTEALALAPGDATVVVAVEAEFLLEVINETRVYLAVEPADPSNRADFTYCAKAGK